MTRTQAPQTDYVEAAMSLVKKLAAPPQAHSVYIRTAVDEATKAFTRTLCVSWHPGYTGKKDVPNPYLGWPTEIVPWPKDL